MDLFTCAGLGEFGTFTNCRIYTVGLWYFVSLQFSLTLALPIVRLNFKGADLCPVLISIRCFNEVIRLPSFRKNNANIHDNMRPHKLSEATQSTRYRDDDDSAVDAYNEGGEVASQRRDRHNSTERSPLLQDSR